MSASGRAISTPDKSGSNIVGDVVEVGEKSQQVEPISIKFEGDSFLQGTQENNECYPFVGCHHIY